VRAVADVSSPRDDADVRVPALLRIRGKQARPLSIVAYIDAPPAGHPYGTDFWGYLPVERPAEDEFLGAGLRCHNGLQPNRQRIRQPEGQRSLGLR